MFALLKEKRNRIFLLPLFAVLAVFIFIEAFSDNDLRIYLSASRDIFLQKNIYTEWYKQWFHYYYSPLFAILIYPLNCIPLYTAQFLWLLLDVWLVIRTWNILSEFTGVTSLAGKKKLVFHLIVFFIVLRFLRDNFHYGQVTILLLWFSVEGLNLIFSGKKMAGAALIALGINIKIFPVILVPYLLYRGEFRSTIFILLFFIAFLFIPSFFIGHEQNMFLLQQWWELINPANKQHIIDTDETSFHGLSTLIPTLLMKSVPDPHALALKRNIADLSYEQVSFILNAVRAFFILLTFYFLRTRPFRKNNSRPHRLWEIGYLFLVVPLIFPHQQHYAFYLSLPAVFYLVHFIFEEKKGRKKNFLVGTMLLVFLTFNANLLLGEYKEYYDHFKIVTYAAILLIVLLAICRPRELIKKARE